ncbi:TerC family protein [Aneurinibacillus migulanus]|uniref:TerC family protein n=1 Tax=Aneurinibacillus migulanus TaxID=47500 RepID=UPI002E2452B7|nr:TerC family protein [Aneurinibacillus migulanus]
MEMLVGIWSNMVDTYAQFFDLEMWAKVLVDPTAWSMIFMLILLEGLLSADNALVLAVLVKHLPRNQQKKALIYGMAGAIGFRFIAIGMGSYLVSIWFVKLLGALYLLKMTVDYFKNKGNGENEEASGSFKSQGIWKYSIAWIGLFWTTIIQVELMDIAFSVDSILAAIALSDQVWVLLMGGSLGILAMRLVAGIFLKLLDAIPEFETTAFVLIALISIKMLLGTVHNFAGLFGMEMNEIYINHWLFFSILIITFLGTFVVHGMRKKKADIKRAKAS